ncbi:hypothetical protein [Nocardia neocaledoniensis]|uniref:hypothetical protein n=1 Tax=Nocardia neocaledoniensis TaxID=236511 RepID=UPI002454766E|nr:hypothetical protein [Nocardia neocaledoniensis]
MTTQHSDDTPAPTPRPHVTTSIHSDGRTMMPNPNGDGTWVPCEGTICTNPNHGANTTTPPVPEPTTTVPAPDPTTTDPQTTDPAPAPTPGPVEGASCGDDGKGRWTHLEGGDAAHYGTEWMCSYNN